LQHTRDAHSTDTPSLLQVCTTELGAFAKLEPEFTKRGVKLIGLSANTVDSHGGWIKDINEIAQTSLKFPIIGDKERKVALAYDM
jgi:alkyl hydroperoxide reductase subunit AhpC